MTSFSQNADKNAEKFLEILKVQVTPSSECIEVNDVIVKYLFTFGPKSFQKALNGKIFKVQQKKKTKKQDAVIGDINISNADGYDDTNPLTEFDRAVLSVCISEYLVGNRYTTVNIIFRALIGKVGNVGIVPRPNQKQAIENSIEKLMGTIVDFAKIAESQNAMDYIDKFGNKLRLKKDNLLSASILDAKINGQELDDVIFFKTNSPLFDIAEQKNQIVRYSHELLDVPNLNNTPRIIALKKYVMRRICEIKLHKQLTPTITFDDVFKKCRMTNSPRNVKMDARNAIVKLFQHLKEQNFITDFELVQVRNKFVSVKFTP